jgi:hypothetical protein
MLVGLDRVGRAVVPCAWIVAFAIPFGCSLPGGLSGGGADAGPGATADGGSAPGQGVPPPPTDSGAGEAGVCGSPQRLELTGNPFNVVVAALLGHPSCPVDVTVHVAPQALIGSADPTKPSLLVDGLSPGSVVTIAIEGRVLGAGATGGSGGNGGGGTGQGCGRPGGNGGTAIRLDVPATIQNSGEIFGGGGGGAGTSGCNANAGGGGGAGSKPGIGGPAFSTATHADEVAYCGQDNGVHSGLPGQAGTVDAPGAATALGGCIDFTSGAGGAAGMPGTANNLGAPGGRAGYAIELHNGVTTNIPTGTYATGTGPIRGAVTGL